MTLTVYILSNHTGHLLPNTNMHAKFGDTFREAEKLFVELGIYH